MSEINYTNIDRVLSKIHRTLKDTEINEIDVIEWVGEALEEMRVPNSLEQKVKFLEVKNYQARFPVGLHMILQIAKHNSVNIPIKVDLDSGKVDKDGNKLLIPGFSSHTGYNWAYKNWIRSSQYVNNFTPIRLASNTFFNSLVCRERDSPYIKNNYYEEYTIVGTTCKSLRFSFKEGVVALSYLCTPIDCTSGYPLIPDNEFCLRALTYYVKFKLAEYYNWNGREGYANEETKAYQHYKLNVAKFNNYMKMPKTLDDYQDLLEQTHNLIPNHKRYFNFFGNLTR